ncbi:MAG TPA: hypothetical protein VHO70_17590 [Chitinispirillaceae bacterium]|nr:hypothetical protein [Chitinispirillaceae bacterium]
MKQGRSHQVGEHNPRKFRYKHKAKSGRTLGEKSDEASGTDDCMDNTTMHRKGPLLQQCLRKGVSEDACGKPTTTSITITRISAQALSIGQTKPYTTLSCVV